MLIALCAAVALGGCSVGGAQPAPSTSSPAATVSATHSSTPTPTPSVTRAVAQATDGASPAGPTSTSPTSTGPTAVSVAAAVTITSADWNPTASALEVSAYVDVLQADGTCTLVVTGPGGVTQRISTPAQPDASTTSCGLMSVSRDRLASGSWSGAVEYSAPQTSGQATFGPIGVP
ncbi:MAG: hypothetical protein L6311_15640 [Cellulomonas sp.]|nr:hypothetical protein [Cellulomonas sp.]